MPYDRSLAARVREFLERERGIEEKALFGGLGFFAHGNMAVAVWKEFLIARVGPDAYESALGEPFVQEFDVTGRAMKGWVMVLPDGTDEDADLRNWVTRGVEFARTLPAKAKSRGPQSDVQ